MNKVLLIVLDGFGEGKDYPGNAEIIAGMNNIEDLKKKYPSVLLDASGNAVGVTEGFAGASEPGHLTMGAGRVVWQPLEKINQAIKSGDIFQKPDLLEACKHVREKQSVLHLSGMLSDGGIHSHETHLYTLLELAKKEGVKNVCLHLIGDGRDVPEHSLHTYLDRLNKKIEEIGIGKIGSVIGRYYAMDRDTNWDRTKTAYRLYTEGKGEKIADIKKSCDEYYKKTEREEATDYYLPAWKTDDFKPIMSDDAVIFYNFRSDRARQITSAFTDPHFTPFEAKVRPFFVCMGPYSDIAPVVFSPEEVDNNLGKVISDAGLKQLRIAETEKYAHVTFFFNSQIEDPNIGEDRILIDSPKVPSYAQKPEMSAFELRERVLKELESEKYDFILLNFANLDLVGHSGVLEAAIKACKLVDECTGKVVKKAKEHGYEVIITGDHGNAEHMIIEETGEPAPAHTQNPTRCIIISDKVKRLKEGMGLSNIAPTVLELMGIEKPAEMTGESLIEE